MSWRFMTDWLTRTRKTVNAFSTAVLVAQKSTTKFHKKDPQKKACIAGLSSSLRQGLAMFGLVNAP
jgi:hypothetical protein